MALLLRFLISFGELFILAGAAGYAYIHQYLNQNTLNNLWHWYSADYLHNTLYIVGGALTVYTLWRTLLALIRTAYQIHFSRHLVALHITQPRQETEKDRQEAVEKDFREAIGIMEQLYRSLHQIGQLNLGNTIRSALFHTDLVSFELSYAEQKIDFYVVTNKYYQSIVEKQITSFYPNAYVEPAKELPNPAPKGTKSKSFFFVQKKENWKPFKTYKVLENDPLNAMTNVFSKLQDKDRVGIQFVLRPRHGEGFGGWHAPARKALNMELLKKKKSFGIPGIGFLGTLVGVLVFGRDDDIKSLGTNQPGAGGGDPFTVRDQATDENFKHAGEKLAQPGFNVTIRMVGSSDTKDNAEQITNGIATAFGMYQNEFLNWLENRRIIFIDVLNNAWMLFNYRHRLPAQHIPYIMGEKDCLLVPEELASLYHVPQSRYNYTPLIEWLKYKILPAPVNLPQDGVLLGYNNYRGEKKDIRITPKDRTRHVYIIGKSGSGKSVLISSMARQDILRGDGVGVIDPHGDLIEDILNYIPKERAKDVVLFNPADLDRPMGLNLLEATTPQEKDFASLAAMEIFIKLFGSEVFGPRLQHYFRNGCLTLMDDDEEGATIIDVPRLFTDDEFSKYKISKIRNPVVKSFWEREMAKTGQREKEEMIPYFSAKFGPFVTNTMMRNIIGQKKSAFDFRKIMDERKILLVNLSKGAVGDINAQLLGLIFVNKLNMSAMSRVDVPEEKRPDFWLYVDEFQNFATDTFATILSEARKYHLGLTIAHQYIGQLTRQNTPEGGSKEDPTIRDAVFGNVGTMMNFKIGAADAEYMSKEYAPTLSEQDVINIANYSAYIKLNVDNTTSRPFSITTIWDETGKNPKMADLVKDFSRLKYGRKREFVDAEVAARIGIDMSGQDTPAADGAIAPSPDLPPLHPLLDTDKTFTPLPDELATVPDSGAPIEKITPEKIAAMEQMYAAQGAATATQANI